MKQTFLAGVAILGLVGLGTTITPNADAQTSRTSAMTVDRERGVLTMAPLLERTTPAVVNIRTTGTQARNPRANDMEEMMRRFFGENLPEMDEDDRGRMTASVGSGVIIDAGKGYVLTNAHVVDDADQIEVLLKDRRTFDATLIGEDKQTDIAILKIEARNLTDLDFADSETVKVGDYVSAIGNPFGIGQTVTTGIVSALGRETFNRSNSYQNYIQTDAAINQGNSGGALINSKGELVGINTAILSRSGGSNGIGFAIPANMVKSVMRQLVDYGEVRRGRIGVGIQDITPTLRDAYDLTVSRGAIVTQVSEGTPAETAGIETGDVIIGFDGEEIISASDIRNTVGLVEAGTRTDITFIRDGKRMTAKILVEAIADEGEVELEETVRAEPASVDEELFEGATITEIPVDMDLRGGDAGVLVSGVDRGSRSWRGGLREGDVIRRIDRQDVNDLDDFADLMDQRDGATAVEIQRNGTPLFLAIR